MTHTNAPLSVEGRRRLAERCKTRPIAHFAAEMGISRACASKWVNRWRRHGDAGLDDRSPTPHASPNATPAWVIERIETWRREYKWSAQRITHELANLGFAINRRAVTRHLTRLGRGRRRFIDPDGQNTRKPGKITARWPGHIVHGRDSDQAKAADRARQPARSAATSTCTPQPTASPASPTPSPSQMRKERPPRRFSPEPKPGSLPTESPTSTASSPTTARATDQETSPASSAPKRGVRRPSHTPHDTTARWSATSASLPKNSSTPEASPAKTPAQLRSESGTSTPITDHTAEPGGRPPASRLPAGVTNVQPSYT